MAKALSTNEMTDYLKQAMDLEVSVYSQERAINNSEKYLDYNRPRYIEPSKPADPERVEVKQPQKPTLDFSIVEKSKNRRMKSRHYATVATTIFFSIGSIFLIFGIAMILISSIGTAVLEFVVSALFFAIGVIIVCINAKNPQKKILSDYEAEKAKVTANYEEEMKKYEEKMKWYENENKKEEERYLQEKEIANQQYEEEIEKAKAKYETKSHAHSLATYAVNQMRAPLEETKATLEKLYDIGIIFPKYRNLVATSTMYEYFASGRVSELEGPNGAYNLYEAELRQDLIINKMDVIISQLEDIKANQYSLYMELQKTNSTLEGIASDVSAIVTNTNYIADNTQKIADNTQEIAQAAHITAQCAQVTAKNSEALKYIALIN